LTCGRAAEKEKLTLNVDSLDGIKVEKEKVSQHL
jgi:hypothetical protein